MVYRALFPHLSSPHFRLEQTRALKGNGQVRDLLLVAVNRRIYFQTLAIDHVLLAALKFGERDALVATDSAARMEVIKQVEAVANVRLREDA